MRLLCPEMVLPGETLRKNISLPPSSSTKCALTPPEASYQTPRLSQVRVLYRPPACIESALRLAKRASRAPLESTLRLGKSLGAELNIRGCSSVGYNAGLSRRRPPEPATLIYGHIRVDE
jgi:hypothetical protein